MRQWKTQEPNSLDEFPAILRKMIPTQIPTAYLEGYRDLVEFGNSCGWPKCPKTIFTSNSHISDDVFKAWSAGMVEKGVPLIIGQHGGSYGVMKWFANEEHEKTISDAYLTWGWKDPNSSKTHPVGIYKFGKRVLKKANSGTRALLIQQTLPRYSYKMAAEALSSTFESYIDEQFEFISCLPDKIVKTIVVRLSPVDLEWRQADRWRDRYPYICLDVGQTEYIKQLRSSRIVVATYNATSYLESMSLNVPTVMFWNPVHWELRDSVVPYFEQLKSVGIFHETPQSAARHLTEIWEDVGGWWQSASVQSVRQEFCDRYARAPNRQLDLVAQLIRKIAGNNSTVSNSVAGSATPR